MYICIYLIGIDGPSLANSEELIKSRDTREMKVPWPSSYLAGDIYTPQLYTGHMGALITRVEADRDLCLFGRAALRKTG